MGADKAGLLVHGCTLLARSVALLQPFTRSVHVAVRIDQADDDIRRRFSLLIDVAPLPGPVAGLLSAWMHAPDGAWLVLACDMPGLTRDAIARLVSARDPARGGTAWRGEDDDRPEPLCAIWEPATLARLAALTRQAGDLPVSPRAVLVASDPLLLDPARQAGLSSLNTPADLHRYLESEDGHEP
mgnify:FL=1